MACAIRKERANYPQWVIEADSLAIKAIEKVLNQRLLIGSISTHLSTSSMQNYIRSLPIHLFNNYLWIICYMAGITLGPFGRVICSWRGGAHNISFFSITWHLHITLFHLNADYKTKLKRWYVFRKAISLHWPNNVYFYSTLKIYKHLSCSALKTILQGVGIVLIRNLRDVSTKYNVWNLFGCWLENKLKIPETGALRGEIKSFLIL